MGVKTILNGANFLEFEWPHKKPNRMAHSVVRILLGDTWLPGKIAKASTQLLQFMDRGVSSEYDAQFRIVIRSRSVIRCFLPGREKEV